MIQNKITLEFLKRYGNVEVDIETYLETESYCSFAAQFGLNCLEAIRQLEADLVHYKEKEKLFGFKEG